jgi:HEPN domain-containing protein
MTRRAELVSQWLRKADDDLRLGDLALAASPPVAWGAAFHAQQAAEKSLKGFLTSHGVEFEKVHSIDYLVDLCAKVDARVESVRCHASLLTDYAVEPRYPLPRRDPTEAEAREALACARRVCEHVLGLLPPVHRKALA